MPPLPLPLRLTSKGFTYEQVARQDMAAIYRQTTPGGGVRYEVVRIRIQREHTWPDGTTTPEKEAYPGSTSWGRDGWTCVDRQGADTVFQALLAQQAQAATA